MTKGWKARALLVLFLVLAPHVSPGSPDGFDRPVTTLQVSKDGVYSAGFMYWHTRALFPNSSSAPPEFVILGEVIEVGPVTEESGLRGRTAEGRVRVEQVLRCPERLRAGASRIRVLSSGALVGFKPGDRIVVFMVPYEGHYAIPGYPALEHSIGFRIPGWSRSDEAEMVALLSSDRGWQPESLTPGELRVWAAIDPLGVAHRAIDAVAALATPPAASETGPFSDPDSGQVRVLHHVCEFPTLPRFLVAHEVDDTTRSDLPIGGDGQLYLVGDYAFRSASIYCELVPDSDVDELWILDGRSGPGSGAFPDPLVHLTALHGTLVLERPASAPMHLPVHYWMPEVRLLLTAQHDTLRIESTWPLDDARHRESPRSVDLYAPRGLYLAIRCPADSCEGCGFAALNIDLPPEEIENWRAAVRVHE